MNSKQRRAIKRKLPERLRNLKPGEYYTPGMTIGLKDGSSVKLGPGIITFHATRKP